MPILHVLYNTQEGHFIGRIKYSCEKLGTAIGGACQFIEANKTWTFAHVLENKNELTLRFKSDCNHTLYYGSIGTTIEDGQHITVSIDYDGNTYKLKFI